MSAQAAPYLFVLGLACGLALLALTAYARVSPRWVRWLLMAAGGLVAGRYVAMACFAMAETPERVWALRRLWFGSAVGLTLPGVFAVDALIRHPAMTPKKLLLRFSPFLAAYAALILCGHSTPVVDPVAGWSVSLTPAWRVFASAVQALFVVGFVGLCLLLIRKIPVPPIQTALLALAAAYGYLGLDGVILAAGGWYVRPFLYSEMAALLALWHAFQTAARLQGSP
jgi:hypothetical protein